MSLYFSSPLFFYIAKLVSFIGLMYIFCFHLCLYVPALAPSIYLRNRVILSIYPVVFSLFLIFLICHRPYSRHHVSFKEEILCT